MRSAYFAGGCFWCITPTFSQLKGVSQVISGYSGGSETAPTYDDVKHQRTGHRETIKIAYDPDYVAYSTLLDIFIRNVDPFDEGGQFIDRGHSYTLAVYYSCKEEKEEAAGKIRQLEEKSGRKVYISLEEFTGFYEAEEYHQNYYLKHPEEFEEELRTSGRMK